MPASPAASEPAPPYDRKLIKAWQRIGEGWMNISMKATTQRHASLRRMRDEPSVWEEDKNSNAVRRSSISDAPAFGLVRRPRSRRNAL